MGRIIKNAVAVSVVIFCQQVLSAELPCGVHNAMQMNSESGVWNTQAQHLNEMGDVVELENHCNPINQWQPGTDPADKIQSVQAVNVAPSSPLLVGHRLGKDEDFYTSLLFSMVQVPDSDNILQMNWWSKLRALTGNLSAPSKTCLFYVAASGPAEPVTTVFELNGAKCTVLNNPKTRTYNFYAE